MRSALRLGPVRIEAVGRDRYGRMLGIAYTGRVNINCRMLQVSGVRYISRYDNGGRVRRACRL
jgi:endonuclease YncB( thermonuclease family)